jgi:hypothetical protein
VERFEEGNKTKQIFCFSNKRMAWNYLLERGEENGVKRICGSRYSKGVGYVCELVFVVKRMELIKSLGITILLNNLFNYHNEQSEISIQLNEGQTWK